MAPLLRSMLLSANLLLAFAVLGTVLITLTHGCTRERILANENAALLQIINELVPPERYDNDPWRDTITVDASELDPRGPVTIYRATKAGKPVAAFARITAPDGYRGPIKLLVGVYHDGVLAGARVISHQETPGLGDKLDLEHSEWILGFSGRSLDDPPSTAWKVRKDGGQFDQFTGATVTPRAVVAAVHRFLTYYQRVGDALFAPSPIAQPPH